MADTTVTRHPAEWLVARAGVAVPRIIDDTGQARPIPAPHRISLDVIPVALWRGTQDFLACRTDVIALCVFYPIVGVVLAYLAFGQGLMPLVFPLLAGLALVGPLGATGLYELSRRREAGLSATWPDAFRAFRSPAIGSMVALGAGLLIVFALWVGVAGVIYRGTMGPAEPNSLGRFVGDVIDTQGGHALLVFGTAAGFVFAAAVLVTNMVSFPLLLDRNVGVEKAIRTSIAVARINPELTVLWGATVAALLSAGTATLLIGLAVVMPILGHATWHLYRMLLPDEG